VDYDDIDETRAGYAELQTLRREQQATSRLSDDAPKPPPPHPHEYLKLLDE